ncbi:hypothetical protein GQ464_016780 [Rhodocaloribacter litoris]|uniref:hypothetical protein n=1 Tax=Rhodocaloribacter litoris TaxID=2558931 RepID=UPI001423FB63|nr:hypothetical protein [Rhodocaloribacter litoris]QXD15040.1 hypothetical protein GQ464_016780 [Rhodocaloribacter litoris]GIV62163.1 MAG: hypothetical protein KatS3mg044_1029 [Rhodothermaceae bacterium]
MEARAYLEQRLRRISGRSIAWDEETFTKEKSLEPVDLVDVAVDIAWEELMPAGALERPALEVVRQGGLIVFRLQDQPLAEILPQAA